MTLREAVIEGLTQTGLTAEQIGKAVSIADLSMGTPSTRQLTKAESDQVIAETLASYQLSLVLKPEERRAILHVIDERAKTHHAKN